MGLAELALTLVSTGLQGLQMVNVSLLKYGKTPPTINDLLAHQS
jgi:hypothetical protein